MSQKHVNVNRTFTLSTKQGQVTYRPGLYPIPIDHADHWWSQQFITHVDQPEPIIEIDPVIEEDKPKKSKKVA